MKAYTKDIIQTIAKGKKRFLALALIAALGVCMMGALTAACDDLRVSADTFFDQQNLFDIKIMSTYGLTEEDIESLRDVEGIELVEGAYSETVFLQVDGLTKQAEVKVLSRLGINEPYLLDGEFPMNDKEIVVTEKFINQTGAKIGDTIVIEEDMEQEDEEDEDAEEEEDDKDSIFDLDLETKYEKDESDDKDKDYEVEVEEDEEEPNFLNTEFKIVGVVIDAEDINSAEGAVAFRNNSTTDYTFFVLPEVVKSDIYTAVYITLSGTDELLCYSEEYEKAVQQIIDILELEIKAEREKARFDEIQSDALEKVEEAEKEMNDKFAEAEEDLWDAKFDIEDGWSELLDGEFDMREAEHELSKAERELNKGERELAEAKKELDEAWDELEAGEEAIKEGEESIKEGREQIADSRKEVEDARKEIPGQFDTAQALLEGQIASTNSSIRAIDKEISNAKIRRTEIMNKPVTGDYTQEQKNADLAEINAEIADLETERVSLVNSRNELQASLDDLEQQEQDAYAELDEAEADIDEAEAELNDAEKELNDSKKELEDGRKELEDAQKEYDDARKEVDDGWDELEDGWEEYYDGLIDYEKGKAEIEDGIKEYEDGVKEYEEKKQEALDRIAEARQEIEDLKMTSWYVNDRTVLGGYSNVETDAACIESIGKAFPILFMIVAILVSLTTVSRMVEEDRGLIGTYKALGFSDREIRRKYMIYALLACILGGILGNYLGFVVLPEILFTVFRVMYQIPEYVLMFNWGLAIAGVVCFIIGIVGAAVVSCNSELKIMPAMLMRPKAPKNGSRVLLERVTPIWSRLSFLNKVTARNLFRYKKRLFMTLFGIAGCTSILLAGYTIKDTVLELLPKQYESVYNYDILVVSSDNETLMEYMKDTDVRSYINPMISNIDIINKDGEKESVSLIVLPDGESLRGYINLYNKAGEKVTLTDGMIVSTINAANVLGYTEGDTVTLQTIDLESAEVEVTNVVMNYLGNHLYMTETTYKQLFSDYEANGALVLLEDRVQDHMAYAEDLKLKDDILSVMSIADFEANFDNVFQILNLVVTIVIILAAALAFVVLFTLSTTNISERERELATIKVLGFYNREVHLYVNKETIILTSIGILLGMPIGKVFGIWLMSVLNMPSIYFADTLYPISYLYAAVIAIAFAFIVNTITDRSLDKINPVEALKSIE